MVLSLWNVIQTLYLLKPLVGRGLASSSWVSGVVLAAAWKAVLAPCGGVLLAIVFQD